MQRMAAKNGLKAMAICVRSITEVIIHSSELHTEYYRKNPSLQSNYAPVRKCVRKPGGIEGYWTNTDKLCSRKPQCFARLLELEASSYFYIDSGP